MYCASPEIPSCFMSLGSMMSKTGCAVLFISCSCSRAAFLSSSRAAFLSSSRWSFCLSWAHAISSCISVRGDAALSVISSCISVELADRYRGVDAATDVDQLVILLLLLRERRELSLVHDQGRDAAADVYAHVRDAELRCRRCCCPLSDQLLVLLHDLVLHHWLHLSFGGMICGGVWPVARTVGVGVGDDDPEEAPLLEDEEEPEPLLELEDDEESLLLLLERGESGKGDATIDVDQLVILLLLRKWQELSTVHDEGRDAAADVHAHGRTLIGYLTVLEEVADRRAAGGVGCLDLGRFLLLNNLGGLLLSEFHEQVQQLEQGSILRGAKIDIHLFAVRVHDAAALASHQADDVRRQWRVRRQRGEEAVEAVPLRLGHGRLDHLNLHLHDRARGRRLPPLLGGRDIPVDRGGGLRWGLLAAQETTALLAAARVIGVLLPRRRGAAMGALGAGRHYQGLRLVEEGGDHLVLRVDLLRQAAPTGRHVAQRVGRVRSAARGRR
uniref:Uncharacterized protein n=1 Tax=Oryza rufipogon TaxID=4529 RepID=A0A0E0PKK6_ORYRU